MVDIIQAVGRVIRKAAGKQLGTIVIPVFIDERVRTSSGLTTDARTLAAQVGLAKEMQKYDLRGLIAFHSSVAKAERG